MAFEFGNIANQVDAATAARTLRNKIEAILTTHLAWDFVEEVLSGAVTYRVWKCLGTHNAQGVDFFVFIREDGTGLLGFGASELYDAVGDTVNNFCPANISVASEADWSVGGTSAGAKAITGADVFHSSSNGVVLVNTTSFDYFIQVTNDYLLFATSAGSTTFGAIAGLHESYMPADRVPLFAASLSVSVGAGYGPSYSRQLNPTSGFSNTWTSTYGLAHSGVRFSAAPVTFGGSADAIAQDRFHFSRIQVIVPRQEVARGYLRGLYRDLVSVPYTGTPALVGDTITLAGATYRYLGQGLCVREVA